MNRRSFLTGSIIVLAVGGTSVLIRRWVPPPSGSGSPEELLRKLTASLEGVERIGVHARRQVRSDDERELESELLGRLFPGAPPAALSLEAFVARIAAIVRGDFARGDIVRVAGWDLSQTEVAILALTAVRRHMDTLEPITDDDPLARAAAAEFLRIKEWGPRETAFDQPFNPLNETRSGIWFLAEDVPAGLEVYFDGHPVPTDVAEDVFTISIEDPLRARILRQPGRYQIVALDLLGNRKQTIGEFVVREPSAGSGPAGRGASSKRTSAATGARRSGALPHRLKVPTSLERPV